MELPHGDDFDFSASGQVLEKDHEDDDVVGFEYDEEEDNDEEEDDVSIFFLVIYTKIKLFFLLISYRFHFSKPGRRW